MATGDSGCEAYTAIAWGVGLSHERSDSAGAEGFHSLEGNMCGTVMRGATRARVTVTARAKGSHRNLGGLGSGRQMLRERDGPHREGEEPKPMMHGHEKSDLVIVAVKPTNKARKAPCGGVCRGGRSGVGGAKGGGQGEYAPAKHVRIQNQARVSQALERIRHLCRHTPEAGAVCGKAARTDLGGGRAMKCTSLPLHPLRRRDFRKLPVLHAKLSMVRSPPICRSAFPPSSSSSSTSRPRTRSASRCRPRCSPAPTR